MSGQYAELGTELIEISMSLTGRARMKVMEAASALRNAKKYIVRLDCAPSERRCLNYGKWSRSAP